MPPILSWDSFGKPPRVSPRTQNLHAGTLACMEESETPPSLQQLLPRPYRANRRLCGCRRRQRSCFNRLWTRRRGHSRRTRGWKRLFDLAVSAFPGLSRSKPGETTPPTVAHAIPAAVRLPPPSSQHVPRTQRVPPPLSQLATAHISPISALRILFQPLKRAF